MGMKTKILLIVVMLGISGMVMAQTTEKVVKGFPLRDKVRAGYRVQPDKRAASQGLNLTDAQKDAFKQGVIALHKQLKPMKNELGELKARQKSLMEADKPDMGAINKNIEKIGALTTEIAKIMAKHRLDMRAQLTDEQKLKFDMMKGHMKKQNRPGFGRRGFGRPGFGAPGMEGPGMEGPAIP